MCARPPPCIYAKCPRCRLCTLADTLSGKVAKVVHGHTIYVLDSAPYKIRFAGIDALEKGQAWQCVEEIPGDSCCRQRSHREM
jgi:endonuclease YncB( thermonuclease family)